MGNDVIAVIDHLCSKLGVAIDWTSENAIPMILQLLHEYARYLQVHNGVWLAISTAIGLAAATAFMVTRKAISAHKPWAWIQAVSDGTSSDIADTLMVISTVVTVVAFFLVGWSLAELVKSLAAPDMYAAQKLLELVSKKV